ncbi:MAG: mannose-6-phosphate isomerase [Prevotella sp.]|nr:mannose-6-phosphate isomerase [Prevotella sp.]
MKYFKFKPLMKTMIWGTESWQISGVPDNETLAEDGRSLNEIVKTEKAALVGESNYRRFGDEFPLLIKFIDAQQELSVQVHPNDEVAHRHGKTCGKTEMWYIMDSAPEAKLYNGLRMKITPDQYKQMVADDTICEALAQYSVKEGDCFFIPAGRIHAIGTGCYLAEIQQTSDVTYRIYDYKRKDKDGNYRQLHTQEASESIDYTVLDDYRTIYTPQKNESQLLIECPYFNTAVYDLTEPMTMDYSELDSFVILIGLKGEGTFTIDGEQVILRAGETILIPATAKEVRTEGTVKFLETYVLS